MHKKIIILIILVVVLLLIFLIFFVMTKDNQKEVRFTDVCFKEQCFNVELAKTNEEKATGLMFRRSLADNGGMLFVYNNESWRPIWMKNTLIPLDIVWLNSNKEVVYLVKNVPAGDKEDYQSLKPEKQAQYVLEINTGWLDKLNLQVGDKLTFNLD